MFFALAFETASKIRSRFRIYRHLSVTEMLNDKSTFTFSSSKNSIFQNVKAKSYLKGFESLVDAIVQYFREGIATWTMTQQRSTLFRSN